MLPFVVGLASRTHRALPPLHRLVETGAVVALLTSWHEPVRERLAVDVAEHALRRVLEVHPRPGLDALASIVREVDAAVRDWVIGWDAIDLWQWGGSIAIVHVDGPTARIAQVGAIATLMGGMIAGHADTLAHRVPLDGWFDRDAPPNVVLGSLGGARTRIWLAELEVKRGDRIVLAASDVVPGVLRVDRATHGAHPAVLAEAIIQHAGETGRDRACVVIEIDGPTDGPYR